MYMHMCMHVCVCACLHVCVSAYLHVCIYACIHMCVYMCICACICVHVHVCMCACLLCACMHTCICMYIHIYESIYMYIMLLHKKNLCFFYLMIALFLVDYMLLYNLSYFKIVNIYRMPSWRFFEILGLDILNPLKMLYIP